MQQMISEPLVSSDRLASTVRVIALVAAALLVGWGLSDILLTVFMSVLLAIMLRGAADWIARKTGAPPRAMLAVVSVLSVAGLLAFFFDLAPELAGQTQHLFGPLVQTIQGLRHVYGDTRWGHIVFDNLANTANSLGNNVASYAEAVATATLYGVTQGLIVFVTAIYLAVSPALYLEGAIRLFPIRHRGRARSVLVAIGRTLKWWSLGQLIDMAVVGVLSSVGLGLLDVPLAIALGTLAGLLTFIPYVGAIAAAVPAVLVALTVGWQTALWALGVFTLCHCVEGYVVAPLVQRRIISMPPALSILAMTILGGLLGPLGVVLGTPVAAVLLIATREVYVGEVLGDPDVREPADDDAERLRAEGRFKA